MPLFLSMFLLVMYIFHQDYGVYRENVPLVSNTLSSADNKLKHRMRATFIVAMG